MVIPPKQVYRATAVWGSTVQSAWLRSAAHGIESFPCCSVAIDRPRTTATRLIASDRVSPGSRGLFLSKKCSTLPAERSRLPLPRVAPLLRFASAAVLGSGLIHVAEFHLGLGFKGDPKSRISTAVWMVQHCPMRPELLAIGALASTVIVWALATMRLQMRRLELLSRHTVPAASEAVAAGRRSGLACHWRRLASVWAALAAIQWALFAAAQHFVPMSYIMEMHGSHMVMGASPPMPAWALALVVGAAGALILAKFERRLVAIVQLIRERIRVLFAAAVSCRPPHTAGVLMAVPVRLGPVLYSRPPPSFSSAS